ncbi:MAG: hypothetical protein EZS28_033619 [Streblomastix strix]|uniref:Uncharacterized protein n=1 Tax=Streblomastix strix TaxID=222440 RepID=A0A5J4UM95_9EUKA|nr:MAG: hypothetical protein EZS28_033619 [Streblomastix strix]
MKQQVEQQRYQQQSQQQTQSQSQLISQYSPPYSISLTDLRFFTCNGPMLGCSDIRRPDMAISQFVSMLRSKRQRVLTMYGDGEFKTDYTSVFDVVEEICLNVISCINRQKVYDCELKIYNIGEDHTSSVKKIIVLPRKELGLFNSKKYEQISKDKKKDIQNVDKINKDQVYVKEKDVQQNLERGTNDNDEHLLHNLINRGWVKSVPPPPGDIPHTITDLTLTRKELKYDPKIGIIQNIRSCIVDSIESEIFEESQFVNINHGIMGDIKKYEQYLEQQLNNMKLSHSFIERVVKFVSLPLATQLTSMSPFSSRFGLDSHALNPYLKHPALSSLLGEFSIDGLKDCNQQEKKNKQEQVENQQFIGSILWDYNNIFILGDIIVVGAVIDSLLRISIFRAAVLQSGETNLLGDVAYNVESDAQTH